MSLTTIAFVAAAVWICLLIVVVALCRAAAHADTRDDHLAASL